MTALEEFGLSVYESKVFKTLLSLGISEAREISNQSQVPFGRIYDVLNSLESKGLIEKQQTRPTKYVANDPKVAIKLLINNKKNQLDKLINQASSLENQLNKIYKKPTKDSLFWSVEIGNERVHDRLNYLIEANETIFSYFEISDIDLQLKEFELLKILPIYSELIERGVVIRILLGYLNQNELNAFTQIIKKLYKAFNKEINDSFQIKTIESYISNSFDIIDSEKTLLKIRNPAKPNEYLASIYFWHSYFAKELIDRFQRLWKNASKLDLG
ncbi:MAG: TrmB family transcriptional regulator [Candidatus Hermodarchaeota archaeon]